MVVVGSSREEGILVSPVPVTPSARSSPGTSVGWGWSSWAEEGRGFCLVEGVHIRIADGGRIKDEGTFRGLHSSATLQLYTGRSESPLPSPSLVSCAGRQERSRRGGDTGGEGGGEGRRSPPPPLSPPSPCRWGVPSASNDGESGGESEAAAARRCSSILEDGSSGGERGTVASCRSGPLALVVDRMVESEAAVRSDGVSDASGRSGRSRPPLVYASAPPPPPPLASSSSSWTGVRWETREGNARDDVPGGVVVGSTVEMVSCGAPHAVPPTKSVEEWPDASPRSLVATPKRGAGTGGEEEAEKDRSDHEGEERAREGTDIP